MTKLPVFSGEQVIKALKRAGFCTHHQKGSHFTRCMKEHPQVRVVVPIHRVVKKGTLRSNVRRHVAEKFYIDHSSLFKTGMK